MDCYSDTAVSCFKCEQPIIGQKLTANGKHYHPECFDCTKCGLTLVNEEFVPHDGGQYHNECYRKQFGKHCQQCGKYIEGQFYEMSNGDKTDFVHPDC